MVGGIVIPCLARWKPEWLPKKLEEIYPSGRLMLVAFLVLIPHMIEKLGDAIGLPMFVRVSEVQELYMFYFVLLYLWELCQREISQD